jgi:hypothetical protein
VEVADGGPLGGQDGADPGAGHRARGRGRVHDGGQGQAGQGEAEGRQQPGGGQPAERWQGERGRRGQHGGAGQHGRGPQQQQPEPGHGGGGGQLVGRVDPGPVGGGDPGHRQQGCQQQGCQQRPAPAAVGGDHGEPEGDRDRGEPRQVQRRGHGQQPGGVPGQAQPAQQPLHRDRPRALHALGHPVPDPVQPLPGHGAGQPGPARRAGQQVGLDRRGLGRVQVASGIAGQPGRVGVPGHASSSRNCARARISGS